jgi:hypothetical protein
MAADTLKSTSITSLDATPNPSAVTTGEGAAGLARTHSDYVTPTTGGLASTSSTYKVLRVKSNIKLKSLTFDTDAAMDSNATPTLSFDVGAYYSDSTVDGTAVANQGVQISANCFAAALLIPATSGAQHNFIDVLRAYGVAKRIQPLWQGLALSSDPGGYIDIVVAVHAVAATAVSSNMALTAEYAE